MALSADIMRQHFDTYASSNLTVAAYCQAHEISVASFYYWRRKIAEPARDQVSREGFSQIITRPMEEKPRVILPGGLQIVVAGLELSVIASLIVEIDRAYA